MKPTSTFIVAFLLIVFAIGGAAFSPNTYWLYVLGLAGIFSIVGYGLALLIGLAGQISIGHAAFFGIGAYTEAILATNYGFSFWSTIPFTFLFAFLLGFVLAAPALRVKGPYLAMVTIAFSLIVENIIIEAEPITGGFNGIANIDKPQLFDIAFNMRWHVGFIMLCAMCVGFGYCWLKKTRFGKSLIAANDSETAAISVGINPVRIRSLAFAISAGITGFAGALFAPLAGFISPDNFNFLQSILFLLLTILGGVGTLTGPAIGALIIAGLPEILSGLAEYRLLVFGILLVAILWIRPNGIASLFEKNTTPVVFPEGGHYLALEKWLKNGIRDGILKIQNLSITFGGVKAVQDVSFEIQSGHVQGLIGPNGAGKTTLLNLISRFYQAQKGQVIRAEENFSIYPTYKQAKLGISRTFQATQLFTSLTVYENLLLALPKNADHNLLINELLTLVGYTRNLYSLASDLPFVDRRLVEIARALACNPDLVLLDEPAAGLSTIEKTQLSELLKYLAGIGIRILLVEHDVRLVMNTCDQIVVLDSGQLIAHGTPSEVRVMPQVIASYLGTNQLQALHNSNVTETKTLLQISNLKSGYGNLAVLDNINLIAKENETLALIGANGAGKSTLMKAISGLLDFKGEVFLNGVNLALIPAYKRVSMGVALSPEGRQVFSELTVEENLLLGGYTRTAHERVSKAKEMLKLFPRLRERLYQPAGVLSGGEQQMLALARALMSSPKLLLLDEPSLGLSPKLVAEVYKIIQSIGGQGTSIILVDQFAKTALQVASRGYVFSGGKIKLEGNAQELLQSKEMISEYLGDS